MKKILIISYYWPPASGPGVQRWLKFAKYLPQYDVHPIIITPRNGSYPNRDETLLNEVPASIKVVRTKTVEPFQWYNILTGQSKRGKSSSVGMGDIKGKKSLVQRIAAYIRANWFIPDARVGWVPYASMAAEKILKENNIDAVVTTGPPHSTHLVGLRLKKKYGVKWVADMRDPWTEIYYNAYLPRTEKSRERDQKLEDEVLKAADLVTVVSPGLKASFEDWAKRIEVIYNGYDEADFELVGSSSRQDHFTISYIGNFKANQNIPALWQALAELTEEKEELKKYLKLELTGNIDPEIIKSIEEYGLTPFAKNQPFVDHQSAVKKMIESSALLFPIPQAPNNKEILTGKIFEYLASGTPLISIGPPDGDAANILRSLNRAEMLDYQEKEGIKKRISSLFETWLDERRTQRLPVENVKAYSRMGLTGKLAKSFESLHQ